jgi:hypothetical protein
MALQDWGFSSPHAPFEVSCCGLLVEETASTSVLGCTRTRCRPRWIIWESIRWKSLFLFEQVCYLRFEFYLDFNRTLLETKRDTKW